MHAGRSELCQGIGMYLTRYHLGDHGSNQDVTTACFVRCAKRVLGASLCGSNGEC